MTYLNRSALAKSNIIMTIQLLIGGIGTFFYGAGILFILTGYGSMDPDSWPVCLLIIPHILLLRAGMRRKKLARRAALIDTSLRNDTDGEKKIKDLANELEMGETDLTQDLNWLFQRQFFPECVYSRDGTPAIYFKMREQVRRVVPTKRTVTVRCPNCGASNTLIAGRTGKCEYCDAPITSRARKS